MHLINLNRLVLYTLKKKKHMYASWIKFVWLVKIKLGGTKQMYWNKNNNKKDTIHLIYEFEKSLLIVNKSTTCKNKKRKPLSYLIIKK